MERPPISVTISRNCWALASIILSANKYTQLASLYCLIQATKWYRVKDEIHWPSTPENYETAAVAYYKQKYPLEMRDSECRIH